MTTFCYYNVNIRNWHCANICMIYISNIRYLHIMNITNIKQYLWNIFLSLKIFPMVYQYLRNIVVYKKYYQQKAKNTEILDYNGNISNVKPISQKYWLYNGNISNVKSISQKYWLYNGNISNVKPILKKYWLYIRNIFNEKLIFQKYWLYFRSISNERLLF